MVTDLFVVHKGFGYFHRLHGQGPCQRAVRTYRTGFQPFLNGGHNIAANVSGVGSRVSEHFMIFIKSLHNIQRFLCGKTEFFVGISLQFGQIIQPRSSTFSSGSCPQKLPAANPTAPPLFLFHAFFLERTDTAAFLILPGPAVFSCQKGQSIVFLRFKTADFCLSCRNHSKGGRLDTSAGKLGIGIPQVKAPAALIPTNQSASALDTAAS